MIKLIPLIQWILDITPLLTLLLVVILLIRKKVQHYFGSRLAYQLWALPLVWVVASWGSSYLLTQLNNSSIDDYTIRVPAVSHLLTDSLAITDVTTQPVEAAPSGFPTSETVWLALAWIWSIGFLAILMNQAIGFMRFQAKFQNFGHKFHSAQLENMLTECGFPKAFPVVTMRELSSPALYGVFRYCLLLPEDFYNRFNFDQRKTILKHEYVHYTRQDNLLNLLVLIARMLFWFNPVVCLAHKRFRFDQELSCDYHVLANASPRERQHYAAALVRTASGGKYSLPGFSAWGETQNLKERTAMLNTHHLPYPGKKARLALLLGLLVAGTLASTAINSQESSAQPMLDVELIPSSLLDAVAESNRRITTPLEISTDRVPADSEYLVFVIDTSGSMFSNPSWPAMIERVQDIVELYPDIKGIQVMNDMGDYLLSSSRGQWVDYSSAVFDEILSALSSWNAYSNSSPVEGIREAVNQLVSPGMKISIYVMGDDLQQGLSIDGVIEDVARINLVNSDGNPRARIHTVMFPTILVYAPEQFRESAYDYLALMRNISRSNGGTFELIETYE